MSYILIVEDNADLAFGLRRALEFEGYDVDVAEDGERALAKVSARAPELIVLDVMLPGRSGFEVLRELREGGFGMPVLMLTARGEEADVVLGFDSGADDYVTKPFSTVELLARLRALLRRGRNGDGGATRAWGFGDVRVDAASRTVRRGDEDIALTPKEFADRALRAERTRRGPNSWRRSGAGRTRTSRRGPSTSTSPSSGGSSRRIRRSRRTSSR